MEYTLNKKEKAWMKKNGKKLCLYWEETKWQRIILIYVFTWLPILVAPIVALINSDWTMGVASICMVGFFTWIPAGIYYNIHNQNSESFCKYYGNESLVLEDERVVYKVQMNYSDFCKQEYQMDFDKITKIEKNEKLRKVRIYGTYAIPITEKSDDGRGVKTEIYNSMGNREMWCDLPLYYEKMDELIEIISEKSHIPVVKVKQIHTPEGYVSENGQPAPNYIEVPV